MGHWDEDDDFPNEDNNREDDEDLDVNPNYNPLRRYSNFRDEDSKSWAKNVRDDIKSSHGLSDQDCEDRANAWGPNWANIMCGLGDQ